MSQANTMYSKKYELSMSTSNKAHLHRSINAEAKANKHITSDMTYKEFKVESTHVIYHNHVDITIT